jgi:hypothetical protein
MSICQPCTILADFICKGVFHPLFKFNSTVSSWINTSKWADFAPDRMLMFCWELIAPILLLTKWVICHDRFFIQGTTFVGDLKGYVSDNTSTELQLFEGYPNEESLIASNAYCSGLDGGVILPPLKRMCKFKIFRSSDWFPWWIPMANKSLLPLHSVMVAVVKIQMDPQRVLKKLGQGVWVAAMSETMAKET